MLVGPLVIPSPVEADRGFYREKDTCDVSIRRRPRVTARNLQERLKEQQRGILRGGGVRDRRLLPVPGKQLVQPPGGVVGDPA